VPHAAADLHALLHGTGIAPLYVLVARSYGSLIARLYTSRRADQHALRRKLALRERHGAGTRSGARCTTSGSAARVTAYTSRPRAAATASRTTSPSW
jgi:pimeloyl-ACP methyl ester carboxylesterase